MFGGGENGDGKGVGGGEAGLCKDVEGCKRCSRLCSLDTRGDERVSEGDAPLSEQRLILVESLSEMRRKLRCFG